MYIYDGINYYARIACAGEYVGEYREDWAGLLSLFLVYIGTYYLYRYKHITKYLSICI